MSNRASLFPLVLAAYPVLVLYQSNMTEVSPDQVLPSLIVCAAFGGVVLGVGWLFFRDLSRAAVAAGAFLALFFGHGHLRNLLIDSGWDPFQIVEHRWLLAIELVVLTVVIVLVWRTRRDLGKLVKILGIFTVTLVAVALVQVVPAEMSDLQRGDVRAAVSGIPEVELGQGPDRDIYYIVMDRYGNGPTLERAMDYDNSPFLDWLRERDFQIVDEAHANYQKTAHSLASTLNLSYLDGLATSYGRGFRSFEPIHELMQRHEVGEALKDAGYHYVHIGSWYEPTKRNPLADDNPVVERLGEFSGTFFRTTMAAPIAASLGRLEGASRQRLHYETGLFGFEQLERARELSSEAPKFVFAHVLLPHDPFVFTSSGDYKTERDAWGWRPFHYREQVHYTNELLREALGPLIDGPDEDDPIVILQADEGPYPHQWIDRGASNWMRSTEYEMEVKFGILSAYHLPGPSPPQLPAHHTPVNTFRVVFDHYFGTELGRVPDRAVAYPHDLRPLDFHDVTRKARR